MSFTSKLKEELFLQDEKMKFSDREYALGVLCGLLISTCETKKNNFVLPIDKKEIYIKIVYIYEVYFGKIYNDTIKIDKIITILFDGFLSNSDNESENKICFEHEVLSISKSLLSNTKSLRGLLLGLFWGCGYITNPEVDYHLEFDTKRYITSTQIQYVLTALGFSCKLKRRKHRYMIYIKDAEAISDVLKMLMATKSLFVFEDVRVIKEVRNDINRKVNCEVANQVKIVNSAQKHIKDIDYIIEKNFFDTLSSSIKVTAKLRKEFPDDSLKELGEKHCPPISKSKVNYRLKKIGEFVDGLKGN